MPCLPATTPKDPPANVGGYYGDYAGYATDEPVTRTVVGSFIWEGGFTKETDQPSNYNNRYSLQLNTGQYYISYDGWYTEVAVQFLFRTPLYGTLHDHAYIEYWLINYNTQQHPCPYNWNIDPGNPNDCFYDSQIAGTNYEYPNTLYQQSLSGSYYSGTDEVTYCSGSSCWRTTNADLLQLGNNNWNEFEFNVFGQSSGGEAVFNSGFSLGVQVGPTFYDNGFCASNVILSAETNNLNLGSCSYATGTSFSGAQYSESD
jgi:hypothetical protein